LLNVHVFDLGGVPLVEASFAALLLLLVTQRLVA
jgi:hypothetical protein